MCSRLIAIVIKSFMVIANSFFFFDFPMCS